jgi:hypothetical protein
MAVDWVAAEWNVPSRTDHYLMQIACEVTRGRIKNPRDVQNEDYRIRFQAATTTEKPLSSSPDVPPPEDSVVASSPEDQGQEPIGPQLPKPWTKESIEKAKTEVERFKRQPPRPMPLRPNRNPPPPPQADEQTRRERRGRFD